jgi:hypothetical protein
MIPIDTNPVKFWYFITITLLLGLDMFTTFAALALIPGARELNPLGLPFITVIHLLVPIVLFWLLFVKDVIPIKRWKDVIIPMSIIGLVIGFGAVNNSLLLIIHFFK